jgi:hypothetical protein
MLFNNNKIIIPFLLSLTYFFNNINVILTLDYTPYYFHFLKKTIYFSGKFYLGLYLLSEINIFLKNYFIIILFFISAILATHYITKLTKHKHLMTLIYLFNPFVYSKIMVGQLGILVAYLLLPTVIYYTQKFIENKNKKTLLKLALAFTFASSFSIHFLIINAIIIITYYIYHVTEKRNLKLDLKLATLGIIIIILLNIFWLQGFLLKDNNTLSSIDSSHEQFFTPKLSHNVPTIAKIMGMWGFWREASYITTYKTLPLPLWYLLLIMFVATMLIGYYTKKDDKKEGKKVKFFYTLWWIGLILATGISHPWTAPIFDFLFKYLPFFKGFRDSHKFVIFIALAYATLCPIGIYWVRDRIKNLLPKKRRIIIKFLHYAIPLLFIIGIITFTYPLIGLWGQIKPCDYPDSYQQTNSFLESNNLTGHVIYLPWEGYLTYNWTLGCSPDGRIATPINKIVKPIIQTSPGQWGRKTEFKNNISNCLAQKNTSCLKSQNVQYILKDRCALYPYNYDWLNQTPVYNDSCIEIHELTPSKQIDRSIHVPIRFIIGSVISIITLIGMIIYLILNRKH